MRDPRVGVPLHKRYRSTVIQAALFALAVLFQVSCTEEHHQEPLAPKVVIRMKTPSRPPSAPEGMSPTRTAPWNPQTNPPSGAPAETVTARSPSATSPRPTEPPAVVSPVPTKGPGNGAQNGGGSVAPAAESRIGLKPGRYRVRPGDTLSAISAREDVYGNALKWTSLYRLNMGKLGVPEHSQNLPDMVLPEGTLLTYLTSEKAKANLDRLGTDVWVVNVASSKIQERIVPAALELMKDGFRVYISRARVKGEDWMRLRAGFFGGKGEAEAAGERIAAALGTGRLWVAKADPEELRESGGY
jgi:hypothetical protein